MQKYARHAYLYKIKEWNCFKLLKFPSSFLIIYRTNNRKPLSAITGRFLCTRIHLCILNFRQYNSIITVQQGESAVIYDGSRNYLKLTNSKSINFKQVSLGHHFAVSLTQSKTSMFLKTLLQLFSHDSALQQRIALPSSISLSRRSLLKRLIHKIIQLQDMLSLNLF